jgi:hypothetical protein
MRFRTLVFTDVTKENVLSTTTLLTGFRQAVQYVGSQLQIDDARPKLDGTVGQGAIKNRFFFPSTV